MSDELVNLLAKRFIQRRDVKAIQVESSFGSLNSGDYFPDTKIKDNSKHSPQGFKASHIHAHLNREVTYGHYLLDADSKARVFVLDIDLTETGSWVRMPSFEELGDNPDEQAVYDYMVLTEDVNPRKLWHDRSAIEPRTWYKSQMRMLAEKLTKTINEELDLPTASAYSGNKGIHVYGFTGEMPGEEVREAALLALDISNEFEPSKGKNFYRHKNDDPIHGFQNFSIEVFPKQANLESKSLGNLVRLPLGKNMKSPKDPTFFIDQTAPLGILQPHADPIKLLESGNPWL